VVGPNYLLNQQKNIAEIGQKDRRRNIGGLKRKRRKKIKTWKDFWAAEN
jgi:hypothetical protein